MVRNGNLIVEDMEMPKYNVVGWIAFLERCYALACPIQRWKKTGRTQRDWEIATTFALGYRAAYFDLTGIAI